MKQAPRFAVVGHPNKGKSSIVATLSHNDGIAISEMSGTTQVAKTYPYSVDGHEHYVLIDTPGFQRPRQVLAWLEKHAVNAAQRPDAVIDFTELHRDSANETGKYKDEVELLTPIVQGAGIIYVVDGSVPYTPEYEAEMTILQWTGQPRMALINPIGGEAHVAEWEQALGQFFSLVKVFNPLTAGLQKQLAILAAFAELNPDWRKRLENSVAQIADQYEQTKLQAAHIIAEALVGMIAYAESAPVLDEKLKAATESAVSTKYQTELKRQEQALRQRLIELYALYNLDWDETQLEAEYPDMFDQDFWYLFGLSRQKLVALATSAGAAAGALLDVGVGGSSFMAGALAGGLLSGAASFFVSARPEQVKLKGIPLGGKKCTAGPVKNMQFAYVLLGRALGYQYAVSGRAHADQSRLVVEHEAEQHWIEKLEKTEQVKLTRLIQKAAKGLGASELKQVQGLIVRLL